jgi:hypothetical protein
MQCIVGSAVVEGSAFEACLCTPGYCSRTSIPFPGCIWVRDHLTGDTEPFECAMYVPTAPALGFCVRSCDDTRPCPSGMFCVSIVDTFGVTTDVDRACVDLGPAP